MLEVRDSMLGIDLRVEIDRALHIARWELVGTLKYVIEGSTPNCVSELILLIACGNRAF